MIKCQRACLHRLIGFLVPSKRLDSSCSTGVQGGYEHCDALAVPLTGLIEPFFYPPQQQGVSTLLTHGDREAILLKGRDEVQSLRANDGRDVYFLFGNATVTCLDKIR